MSELAALKTGRVAERDRYRPWKGSRTNGSLRDAAHEYSLGAPRRALVPLARILWQGVRRPFNRFACDGRCGRDMPPVEAPCRGVAVSQAKG